MNNATKFKNLVTDKNSESILLPVVHDAIAAKIAEQLGYYAVSIGGFAISGINYGLPDVGLLSLTDMESVIKHIVTSVNIPIFADADGGYGNERNVIHTIKAYENIGVASLFIEDQKHPKRCGHMNGKELIHPEEMGLKIQAAVKARENPDFMICARTDAIAVEGFKSAIERAKLYIQAGADIIFIEAPETIEQLQEIPKIINQVPLLVNMLEGGKTPLCNQKQLNKMGYKIIAYPVTTMFSAINATKKALEYLKKTGETQSLLPDMISFEEYKKLVNLEKYI